MKRIVLLFLVLLIGAISSLAMFLLDDPPDENPEFYFTRLAYSENGIRGWGRFVSKNFRCPEFGGGNFFPPQGLGWSMDSPGADCKYMGGIHRLTNLRVYPNPNMIRITDPNLFKFPYAYIVEPGGMDLTDEEVSHLREYLLRGGFIHADDFWGLREKANFEYWMKRVLPEYSMEVLPLSHEVFHTFYDIDAVLQPPNDGLARMYTYSGGRTRTWEQPDDTQPHVRGVLDDTGRLMVLITYNADLGDAWEWMDDPDYPAKFTGYAYRLGMNAIIYAMTH